MTRILVIDDVRGVRRSIASTLKRSGYEVDEAENGRDGLEKALSATYDLVITDILMPDMDGSEVITALRRDRPSFKILAVSGGGSLVKTEDALIFAKSKADGVIPKPFESSQLLALVDKLVKRASA